MKIYKTAYIFRLLQGELNPFTGTTVNIHDDYLELKQRSWYLISVDTSNIYFKNVIGVSVDKRLFWADLVFRLKGDNNYVVYGFSKSTSNRIRDAVKKAIKEIGVKANRQIVDGITNKIGNRNNKPKSVIEELKDLKELLDSGVLTQEEFEQQKKLTLR